MKGDHRLQSLWSEVISDKDACDRNGGRGARLIPLAIALIPIKSQTIENAQRRCIEIYHMGRTLCTDFKCVQEDHLVSIWFSHGTITENGR